MSIFPARTVTTLEYIHSSLGWNHELGELPGITAGTDNKNKSIGLPWLLIPG